jgi:N-methylhydantoinase A
MQVGPISAGSTPGPACFDRGGEAMTVTDAALLCGILGHGVIGFGAISPKSELAEAAARPIAEKLGLEVAQLAEGVLKVAVSGLLIPIEQLLARAGVHASELTLMPFGGAGPMIGALLAEAAGVRKILVPAAPGTLCALGAASAAIRRDTLRTVLLPLTEDTIEHIGSFLNELEKEAEAAIVDMDGNGTSTINRAADLRYKGQSFEITIPVTQTRSAGELIVAFHEAHRRTFGHADPDTPVQVVNLRVSSSRPPPDIRLPESECAAHTARATGSTRLYSGGEWCEAKLYERSALGPGAAFTGPAIVVQDDTTLLVPKGWIARVDGFRNIEMEVA